MCLPRNLAPSLAAISRQRWRLAATSRMPTVICVGRRSLMATVVKMGSRTIVALLEQTFDSALSASVREQNQGSRAGSRPQQGEWQFPAARLISQHARDGTGGNKARRYS